MVYMNWLGLAVVGSALMQSIEGESLSQSDGNEDLGTVVPKGRSGQLPLPGLHPQYPFDSLVFMGGGAKGTIYIGAIQALEELGMLPYLKRFAGASAGSSSALCLALGLNAEQAQEEMDNMDMMGFLDGGFTIFGKKFSPGPYLGYRMLSKLGMNPGDSLLKFYEDLLEKYTGDPNLTFLELYKRFGTELCVSVANISRSQNELLHVNTTPELPIKYAIRASMSLPFVFDPVRLGKNLGLHPGDVYIDGGILNNFPIKAFDGYFLSTKEEDSLLKMASEHKRSLSVEDGTDDAAAMQALHKSIATSYAEPNMATIGFRLTNDDSLDQMAYSSFFDRVKEKTYIKQLEKSNRNDDDYAEESSNEIPLPDTKLAQKFQKAQKEDEHLRAKSQTFELAFVEMHRWLLHHGASLRGEDPIHPQGISVELCLQTLKADPPKEPFRPDTFGFRVWEDMIAEFDNGGKGYFTRTDMSVFWDRFGLRQAYLQNRKSTDINTIGEYVSQMVWSSQLMHDEHILRDPVNAARACTLDTKYVGTMSFEMEDADKEYLYALGKAKTVAWINNRADILKNAACSSTDDDECNVV